MKKSVLLGSISILVSIVVVIALGEILLRQFSPQPSMYPRWDFSQRYGHENRRNTTIVHEAPGAWRFTYTLNEYRYRGPAVPVSNEYLRPNIVILGDSYSFGAGVNDGEEYATVLQDELGKTFDVVNLGVGGWGLTHEIRRYYEFGRVYQPTTVILQFSSNDPQDNMNDPVSIVRNDRIEFQSTTRPNNWLMQYLSGSVIQKSQIYNLIRIAGFGLFGQPHASRRGDVRPTDSQFNETANQSQVYNALLETFAQDLAGNDIQLIVISINGQLDEFPLIKAKVQELYADNVLHYIETSDWFTGITDYQSPEGHRWGAKAHRIVGEQLAAEIAKLQADRTLTATQSTAGKN